VSKKNFPLGMMMHACDPKYAECVGRRMAIRGLPRQKLETISEK
jgi:hypothetical protein